MEVHPPEHPIHTPRDFFLHLFTITVGLLIALSLEGLVEHVHNRHLLHTAEANLRVELDANRKILKQDQDDLTLTEQRVREALQTLNTLKAHQPATQEINPNWRWNAPESAAWDTARNTGAVALMPYADAQRYSSLYGQQAYVDTEATLYIRDIYRITAPLQGDRNISTLQPAEFDSMIAAAQQTLSQISLLRDLANSLARIYAADPR